MQNLIKNKVWTALMSACFLVVVACSTLRPTARHAEIYLSPEAIHSAEQAVDRSALYAEKMRIDLSNTAPPVAERYVNAYPAFLDCDDAGDYRTRLRAKLFCRDYWVVHYSPRKLQLGGDQVFFLEVSTGALLGHYAGR